jgi:hypothetical protein
VFELSSNTARLGGWHRDRRTIEVSRTLVASSPWGVIVEVLKHEMAHQFVDEVLRRGDESAHGPAFRAVCGERGIDGDACGMPVASAPPDTRIMERVTKLLALAASAGQHEAEAAMASARRLMLRYNLDAIAAREPRRYTFRHLGPAARRVHEHRRWLAMVLVDHFFVEALWIPVYLPLEGHQVSVLEISGTPDNLAIAEYVHEFMLHTAERLWDDHQKVKGTRGGRRLEFVAGVMRGFRDKLEAQTRADTGTGLVWVQDAALRDYHQRRHPRTTFIRRGGHQRTGAFAAGREAGSKIVLHRAVESEVTSRGRLLTASKTRSEP